MALLPVHFREVIAGERRVWLWRAIAIICVLRVVAAVHGGLTYTHGDFYATLPGAHVRELNPVLWNSPDLVNSSAFHRDDYLYGPTQFLTLYPIAWFDTYEDIAQFLLVAYGVLLVVACALTAVLLRKRRVGPATLAAVIAGTAFYLPLLQAYVQREFETVVVVVLGIALYAIVTRRKWLAGAAIGYITWFKFFPIVFLFYFVARGWWRAVAGFVTASVAVLAVSHLVFDLRRFAPVVELVSWSAQSTLNLSDMCYAWLLNNQTFASVRYGLCRIGGPADFARLDVVFWIAVGLALLLFGHAFIRASRVVLQDSADERMRRMLEFSFLVAFSAGVFYAHYYYLAQLVIPINVLVYWYSTTSNHRVLKLSALVVVYILLTVFVIPTSITNKLLGVDAWKVYTQHALYLYGQALLIALLLWEYRTLVRRAQLKIAASGARSGHEVLIATA